MMLEFRVIARWDRGRHQRRVWIYSSRDAAIQKIRQFDADQVPGFLGVWLEQRSVTRWQPLSDHSPRPEAL